MTERLTIDDMVTEIAQLPAERRDSLLTLLSGLLENEQERLDGTLDRWDQRREEIWADVERETGMSVDTLHDWLKTLTVQQRLRWRLDGEHNEFIVVEHDDGSDECLTLVEAVALVRRMQSEETAADPAIVERLDALKAAGVIERWEHESFIDDDSYGGFYSVYVDQPPDGHDWTGGEQGVRGLLWALETLAAHKADRD